MGGDSGVIRGVKKCKRPSVLPASRSQTQTQVPESRNRNPCCWGLAGYAIVLPPDESARSEGQQETLLLNLDYAGDYFTNAGCY